MKIADWPSTDNVKKTNVVANLGSNWTPVRNYDIYYKQFYMLS